MGRLLPPGGGGVESAMPGLGESPAGGGGGGGQEIHTCHKSCLEYMTVAFPVVKSFHFEI